LRVSSRSRRARLSSKGPKLGERHLVARAHRGADNVERRVEHSPDARLGLTRLSRDRIDQGLLIQSRGIASACVIGARIRSSVKRSIQTDPRAHSPPILSSILRPPRDDASTKARRKKTVLVPTVPSRARRRRFRETRGVEPPKPTPRVDDASHLKLYRYALEREERRSEERRTDGREDGKRKTRKKSNERTSSAPRRGGDRATSREHRSNQSILTRPRAGIARENERTTTRRSIDRSGEIPDRSEDIVRFDR